VILILSLAHPKVEAPELIHTFIIQNPRVVNNVMIASIKHKILTTLEEKILPRIKAFKL